MIEAKLEPAVEVAVELAVKAANEERCQQAADGEFGHMECCGFFHEFESNEEFRLVDEDEVPAVLDTPAASSQIKLFAPFKIPETS